MLTVAELCDQHLAAVESGRLLTRRRLPKSPSTLLSGRGRIEGHIKPLLRRLSVGALRGGDVEQYMHTVGEGKTWKRVKLNKPHALSNVRGGRGVASRSVGLIGAILTYAIRRGIRSDNPAYGVIQYANRHRDRRLRDEEYAVPGVGLRAAEDADDWHPALAVIRILMVTGWRSGEALNLR